MHIRFHPLLQALPQRSPSSATIKALILFLVCLFIVATLTDHSRAEAAAAATQGPYKRIISLYSAHTENLVSLGAAAQIIGISQADTYPAQILDKKRYSFRDDTERFLAASPDLVLVRPMIERSYPKLVAKLRQAGIAVISLQPTSVDDIFAYWQELGRLTGHDQEAAVMISQFTGRLETIRKQVEQIAEEERPQVYFESMHAKMKTFAPTSIAMFTLEQAGGRNVATDARQVHDTNIAEYSKERILAHADRIDIFLAQQGRMNPVTIDQIRQETGFQAIKAVRENRISFIDEHLVSRPTMRLIDGVEELHAILYPQTKGRIGGLTP
jgi:iron complex transport system substrate-binding protein